MYWCVDCSREACVFNSDGAYRCKGCQRAHVRLVRAVLAASRRFPSVKGNVR